MSDLDKILEDLPQEILSYIYMHIEKGFVFGSKISKGSLKKRYFSEVKSNTHQNWNIYFVDKLDADKFNINLFFNNLSNIERFALLVVPKTTLIKKKIEGLLIVSNFFLSYSSTKQDYIIWVYEKYRNNPLENENKYLFKYNSKEEIKTLSQDFDKYIPIAISNNWELSKMEEEYNSASVQLALKIRRYINKNSRNRFIGKILLKLIKLGISFLKLIKNLTKLPSTIRGNINELLIRRRVDNVKEFISSGELIVLYAGVQFVNNEGQRSVRLAQEFVKKEKKVLYVYWDYSPKEWNLYGKVNDYLYVIPRSQFLKMFVFLRETFAKQRKPILLIHVSDMEVAKLLPEFTSMGFYTIYDILDDWSEFAKRGQASWYDNDVENFILRNVYKRYAVSLGLITKHSKYEIELLSNGFSATQLTDSPKVNLTKGKINLGYFGHLTKEWFDWNLILNVAKKHPEIVIHVIGYGFPDGLELPKNIKFYGKLLPNQLSGYTKNWDVCLIPFQDIELSKSVNPIKVYEYLYLGKPVVVTGIPGLDKFPYVYFSSNDVDSFMNAVHKAMDNKVDYDKVTDFLKKNRWEDRAEIILARK